MKIPVLLLVSSWAALSRGPADAATTGEAAGNLLSQAAAAQLERLAPFRRSGVEAATSPSSGPPRQATAPEKKTAGRPEGQRQREQRQQLRIPIDFAELLRIFQEPVAPEAGGASQRRRYEVQLTPDRMSKLDKYADKIMQDERVQSYMQERIKRDGYGGYGGAGGGGSGAFVSGLAGQLVGGVVSLSSSSSKVSASSHGHSSAPVYGPPVYHHSYGKESFNIWDFKRAILNTLIQAVKAIGGGVLALKGQLIKGGGFLVSTKGRVISSAGEAITGLGKTLASSAVVNPHHATSYPSHGQVGYAYGTPAISVANTHYDGPPPSPDGYHSTFGAASDDDDSQSGLLIAKPEPSVEVHLDNLQPDHHHDEHYHTEHVPIEDLNPNLSSDKNPLKDVVAHITGASAQYQNNNLNIPANHVSEETPSITANTLQLQDYNQENHDLYPPLGNTPNDDHKMFQLPPKYDSPVIDFNSPPGNPQKLEYPLDVKQYYNIPPPHGSLQTDFQKHNYLPPGLPMNDIRTPDIQLEISNHDITGFESSGYSQYKRHPAGLHLVAHMQEPLKIPILGPQTHRYFKTYGHPSAYMNSVSGIGKYLKYAPGFGIQRSIGYQIRNRRDSSKIHRI